MPRIEEGESPLVVPFEGLLLKDYRDYLSKKFPYLESYFEEADNFLVRTRETNPSPTRYYNILLGILPENHTKTSAGNKYWALKRQVLDLVRIKVNKHPNQFHLTFTYYFSHEVYVPELNRSELYILCPKTIKGEKIVCQRYDYQLILVGRGDHKYVDSGKTVEIGLIEAPLDFLVYLVERNER